MPKRNHYIPGRDKSKEHQTGIYGTEGGLSKFQGRKPVPAVGLSCGETCIFSHICVAQLHIFTHFCGQNEFIESCWNETDQKHGDTQFRTHL